jgi:hypothetical protein
MRRMAWTGSGTAPTGRWVSPNATRTEVVGKIIYLRQHDHFGPARIAMYLIGGLSRSRLVGRAVASR